MNFRSFSLNQPLFFVRITHVSVCLCLLQRGMYTKKLHTLLSATYSGVALNWISDQEVQSPKRTRLGTVHNSRLSKLMPRELPSNARTCGTGMCLCDHSRRRAVIVINHCPARIKMSMPWINFKIILHIARVSTHSFEGKFVGSRTSTDCLTVKPLGFSIVRTSLIFVGFGIYVPFVLTFHTQVAE